MLSRWNARKIQGLEPAGVSRGGRRLAPVLTVVLAAALAASAGGAPPGSQPGAPDLAAAGPGGPFAEIELALEFGTYVGGGCRGTQGVQDVAVDADGNAVVAGFLPWDCDRGFPDFFVTKFTPDGASQSFGHALGGGEDIANGVAVDAVGNIYITGASSSGSGGRDNFPIVDPFQEVNAGPLFTFDAFVMKIDPEAETILYSTFLGGSGHDVGTDIAVDDEGRIVVVGLTNSVDFPTEAPLQGGIAGGTDVFVTVFEPDGSELAFSTYFGGLKTDLASRLAVHRDRIFFTGATNSPDLPTRLPGRGEGLEPVYGGGSADAFVARIDRFRRLGYAGFLGGSGSDVGHGLALDRSGSAHVTGTTNSDDFPVVRALQDRRADPSEADVFLTRLSPSGSRAQYSTYLDVAGSAGCRNVGQEQPFCADVAVAEDGTAFVTASGFFAIAVSKDGRRVLDELEGFGGRAIEVSDDGSIFAAGITGNYELPLENQPHPARRHLFRRLGWLVRLAAEEPESEPGPPAGAGGHPTSR